MLIIAINTKDWLCFDINFPSLMNFFKKAGINFYAFLSDDCHKSFAVISNTPQVSVTEYHKLQAEIQQLKRDLQVECNTVSPLLSLQGFIYFMPLIFINLRAGVGGGGRGLLI